MTPEPVTKGTRFPRFGSKYRYSGKTHYESKKTPVEREQPRFERSLTGKKISSRSMDGEDWFMFNVVRHRFLMRWIIYSISFGIERRSTTERERKRKGK